MNSLADLYVYLDNGGNRKVTMDCRANYWGFLLLEGLIRFWDVEFPCAQ